MSKGKRVRQNRRVRNPQINPELQLAYDHAVLAAVKALEEAKVDNPRSR